jgi:hypothetical protein
MQPANTLAKNMAQIIIDDLKGRRPDWAMVAHLISEELRRAADGFVFKDMLAGNVRVRERFARRREEEKQ